MTICVGSSHCWMPPDAVFVTVDRNGPMSTTFVTALRVLRLACPSSNSRCGNRSNTFRTSAHQSFRAPQSTTTPFPDLSRCLRTWCTCRRNGNRWSARKKPSWRRTWCSTVSANRLSDYYCSVCSSKQPKK